MHASCEYKSDTGEERFLLTLFRFLIQSGHFLFFL